MNLTQLFDLSLQGRAAQPALEFQGASYTFGDIDARANRTAHWLLDQSVRCGDRICVYLPNCLEIIDLFLACTRLGVIFVPVNILYRDREIQHILGDAKPALFVNDRTILADAAAKPGTRPALPTLEGDDIAAIVYTSGTTGVSKGAMLTHNNFLANATNLITCWQITAADRLLLPLPLFHVHGLGNCIVLAGVRLPRASAGAIRTHHRHRAVSGLPADAVLRRADHVRTSAGNRAGGGPPY